jgi:hypothetical protein
MRFRIWCNNFLNRNDSKNPTVGEYAYISIIYEDAVFLDKNKRKRVGKLKVIATREVGIFCKDLRNVKENEMCLRCPEPDLLLLLRHQSLPITPVLFTYSWLLLLWGTPAGLVNID